MHRVAGELRLCVGNRDGLCDAERLISESESACAQWEVIAFNAINT